MENQDIQKAAETISDIEQTTDFETPVADTEKLETRDELTPAQASKLLQQTKTLMDCITPEVEKRLVEQGEYIDRSVVNAAMADFAKLQDNKLCETVPVTTGILQEAFEELSQEMAVAEMEAEFVDEQEENFTGEEFGEPIEVQTDLMTFQMVVALKEELDAVKAQLADLENRIVQHNVRASHKL